MRLARPPEALDDLLERAPCGFLSFSDDGVVSLANATLLKMVGMTREQLVGRHVETILTVGSRIFYQTHLFPLLRMHGRAEEIFLALRSSAGEDIGVLLNAARHERGGQPAFDCVLMRVRERQKYEEELLRARRAADQARNELEEQRNDLQVANSDLEAQALELELQQQQLQQQTAELEEVREELLSMNEDLVARNDEAEHLRAVAEEANRAKSTFLSVMSHELRTPLNAISGYVEILEMEIHGPVTGKQRESLARIARSGRHLLRLVNEVLNLARIEAGHVAYDLTEVAVSEAVAEIVPMVEPQVGHKDVPILMDLDDDLFARVDRDKAQQIILNLLSNAAKFTPTGGRIEINAARSDDHILVRISDTGIGIPSDKLGAIFEPFVQVNASTTRNQEGTGLGLAISRDLARGMGGDLTVESAPGRGSTFTLRLPAAGA